MRKTSVLKLIFLTPLISFLLSTSTFFIVNYPQSYTNIIKFFKSCFEKRATPSLQIGDELFSRLEKRILEKITAGRTVMTQETALDVLEATVRVTAGSSIGTRVIIFSEEINSVHYSYIITNKHVVGNSDEIKVENFVYLKRQTISATISYSGRVINREEDLDLALIQVSTPNSIGRAVSFETTELVTKLTLYQPVYVAGCSLAKPPFVTDGRVARINSISCVITAFSIFGSSGGGAFNSDGKLIGIVRGVSMIQISGGIKIPEPHLTHLISGPLVRSWLIVSSFGFIIDFESLSTHQDFLNQQSELILEHQQQKKAEKNFKKEPKEKK